MRNLLAPLCGALILVGAGCSISKPKPLPIEGYKRIALSLRSAKGTTTSSDLGYRYALPAGPMVRGVQIEALADAARRRDQNPSAPELVSCPLGLSRGEAIPVRLDPDLAAALLDRTGASALLLGNVTIGTNDWRIRRTARQFALSFCVSARVALYDLTSGRKVAEQRLTERTTVLESRRFPTDALDLPTTRIFSIARQRDRLGVILARRLAAKLTAGEDREVSAEASPEPEGAPAEQPPE